MILRTLATDRETFAKVVRSDHPSLGIDLEFTPTGRITLVCAAEARSEDDYTASSLPWEDARSLVAEAMTRGKILTGHALASVDVPRICANLGLPIPPTERVFDTFLWHYLCNADFTKTKEKKDGTESRGTGHLDLWTMASIYTDLNQWKACRGVIGCVGPCPTHDPVGYNAMDGVGPDLARPRIREDAGRKSIPDSLYQHLVGLTEVTELMQKNGCRVDVPYVRSLNEKLEQQKQDLFQREERPKIGKKGQPLKAVDVFYTSNGVEAPFNPNASGAVKKYFKDHGILLAKSDKDSLQKAIRRAEKDNAQDSEVVGWLRTLLEYKQEGKGLDTWFGPEHVDAFGFIHPRFNPCGTSTRRLASSSPNFQNIPKHGAWAKDVRRALIPRSKDYDFARADSKQLELRMVLYLAGLQEDYGDDAFAWLVKRAWDLFEEAVTIVPDVRYKNPKLHESGVPKGHRELAKRVSHAGDYLEGFKVFYPLDLQRERTVSAVREGALVLYQDWEYAGGVVGFTGTNLATSLFGDASWPNRKKALGLQEAYFERFPEIRQWHREMTAQAERGYVTTVSGHYLALRGTPEENAKEAAACHGQGEGAGYVQHGMIALHKAGFTPTINIHDENVVEVPKEMRDNEVKDLMQLMAGEFDYLPGFKCPVDVERGENYVDTRKL